MKKKTYLKQGLKVSTLGFGTWPLGNTSNGRTMSDEDGIALVQEAFKQGINFFDTAPNYSLGKSEIILGKALKDVREQVIINTKFGHHEDDQIDFNETKIRPSIEGSLKRLNTDYIDSVILHNPSLDVLQGKTGHFKILNELKDQGIIRGYGVSIDTVEELRTTLDCIKVDVIELLFNVFSQSTRGLLDEVKENNIALISKVPLDSGWLSGRYHLSSSFQDIRSRWTQDDKNRRDTLVNQLKEIVNDEALIPYALGFIWSYDAVTTVIPGIRTASQLDEHLQASSFQFPTHLKRTLEQFYDEHIKASPLPW